MTLTIQPLTNDRIDDLGWLFSTDNIAEDCWCMWFIIPVKDFHAAGRAGNRVSFSDLATKSDLPLGLLAYQDGEPVGWVAVGPRERYVRAVKTPTYRGGDAAESGVWMTPCFFIREDKRGAGVGRALLEGAVQLARENGAVAVEGFPNAGKKSSSDPQVGFAVVFSACGFQVVRTPSASRVVMRLDLKG